MSRNSFNSLSVLSSGDSTFYYYSLPEAEKQGLSGISRLPYSLKILLENQLRHENGVSVEHQDISAFADWLKKRSSSHEIAYHPARVLMQDFTGVPAVVDLATMREAVVRLGGDPEDINPFCSVDLVIDHSVQIDYFGQRSALSENISKEFERNLERYAFLKWGQKHFKNFRVIPPGMGICHQVNLEYLAKGVWTSEVEGKTLLYPDTLVGTDSHTTMINGMGVLGWGVGGIEAEAAMLSQPVSMVIPEVVGCKLTGSLQEGVTATDLVIYLTEKLRKYGVVGKFVEFYGSGLQHLSLADRATIANMAPEYGATCGFFPVDEETLRYLELTHRKQSSIELLRKYMHAQGLLHTEESPEPFFTNTLSCALDSVEPSVAGPKRPQDRVVLAQVPEIFSTISSVQEDEKERKVSSPVQSGDVVIAAITSCTNTSNPSVMLAAGLLAKKAVEEGLHTQPWVKTSLAPGSRVVTQYLKSAGLLKYLEALGFYVSGYGCTTCIGNSGPLEEKIATTIIKQDLAVSSVLSGNRNFEGRVHPLVKANWLASPPLVVAYALLGNTRADLTTMPLGECEGKPVFLKDIWPSNAEIAEAMKSVSTRFFAEQYANIFEGDKQWQLIHTESKQTYNWQADSSYVRKPPYFLGMPKVPEKLDDIKGARILVLLGDSVTTDHISPAGVIKPDSPAGLYLQSNGVAVKDFNSYGARRGNHEVMVRGTFANIRLQNELVPEIEGGFTRYFPDGSMMPIFDAAMAYKKLEVPLVIIAGKEYGTGSSRDWAAKGTLLLGVRAVVAESFERIHRSNLIGMGVLPLEFAPGVTRRHLSLEGSEVLSIQGIDQVSPRSELCLLVHRGNERVEAYPLRCCIDTQNELKYYKNGGILKYVVRKISEKSSNTKK